jgi:hypothetical protein
MPIASGDSQVGKNIAAEEGIRLHEEAKNNE